MTQLCFHNAIKIHKYVEYMYLFIYVAAIITFFTDTYMPTGSSLMGSDLDVMLTVRVSKN